MNEADYDSDDYDTEGEDLYNVDFTDNFWQQRSDTQAIVNDADDNEDDAEEEGPVDYFQGQIHRLQDFANFLEHCNNFEFVELRVLTRRQKCPHLQKFMTAMRVCNEVWLIHFRHPLRHFGGLVSQNI